ncbi:hypothetical protein E2I41_07410 [Campylobacter lari]|nr:hypothetical protein [Campylobacter lari]EAH6869433.1 hypothetical protein [Campylobacter lari]EAH7781071.1 hypothetical protein [Campylobacter lari]EAH8420569.1 hypothetical protein [Campylobacter lari]EAI0903309.1 hypothetical protein [Campylobacter lari]
MKKIDYDLNAKIFFLKNFKIVFKAFLTLGVFVAFLFSFLSDDYLASFINITSFFILFSLSLFVLTFIYCLLKKAS